MGVISQERKNHKIKFGTDGWRALIAQEFTYDNLALFSCGLAEYLLDHYPEHNPLVIAQDARFLADKFADFAAAIFISYGIPVLRIDHPCPTPVVAHAAKEYNSCGALTFTASHNPAEYMGIKYIPEYAGPATVEITNSILGNIDTLADDMQRNKCPIDKLSRVKLNEIQTAEILAAVDKNEHQLKAKCLGRKSLISEIIKGNISNEKFYQIIDPAPAYFDDLRKVIDFASIQKANKGLMGSKNKIIYDPMYGCGRNYTNRMLEEAGFEVVSLHDVNDPTFGGSLPEPKEEILSELISETRSSKAILGCANDGDADRFAFVSADGKFFGANQACSIIFKYLIEKRGFKGALARTVVTTHLLDEIAKKFPEQVTSCVETAVGFKWLAAQMRSEDTIIAAEESGGMSILGHIPEKDGILAILLMAEVLAVTGKSLSQLWDEVQKFVGKKYFYNRLDLHLDGDRKDKFVELFGSYHKGQSFGDFEITGTNDTEGHKVYLNTGAWMLARPSGTEAMCRVYLESNSEADLRALEKNVKTIVSEL